MARKGLARVSISLTTLDQGLSRSLEPRCPTPARRVNTLKHVADVDIETGGNASTRYSSVNRP